MTVMQSPNETGAAATGRAAPRLSGPLVLLLAAGAGLSVASLYYSQPLLGVLGADIGAGAAAVGWLPTLTQLGYALGLLLLGPLGDRFDRRLIIVGKAVLLTLALLLAAAAPSISALLIASLAIGLTATLAQDIVPAAATLAPEAHRGKVVGTVMTGLLLGILLSRVVSGFVAEHFSWRVMFLAAAVSVAVIAAAIWHGLPRFQPTTRLPYGALLGSLAQLWRRHGSDAARRAFSPGQRRGRGFRPGRSGGCVGRAAGWPPGRPSRAGTGDAPGRRCGPAVIRGDGTHARVDTPCPVDPAGAVRHRL